jgi:hypothetical protein
MEHSSLLGLFIDYEENNGIVNIAMGVLHYTSLERLARDKQSSLLGPFLSYEENVVLLIWPLNPESSILGQVCIHTGVNLIKLYWHKFTYSFCKLGLFITMKNINYLYKMV